MARRRGGSGGRHGAADTGLRLKLAARYRDSAAEYPERVDAGHGDGSFFLAPWRRQAERLEAGEPLDVPGWVLDVPGWVLKRWRPDLETQARYNLDENGAVTELRRGPRG